MKFVGERVPTIGPASGSDREREKERHTSTWYIPTIPGRVTVTGRKACDEGAIGGGGGYT